MFYAAVPPPHPEPLCLCAEERPTTAARRQMQSLVDAACAVLHRGRVQIRRPLLFSRSEVLRGPFLFNRIVREGGASLESFGAPLHIR